MNVVAWIGPDDPLKSWTDDRIEDLKRLWADGHSAREIAERMGCFTHCDDGGRSAVLGKVHRLKLPGRHTVERSNRPRKPQVRRVVPVRAPSIAPVVPLVIPETAPDPALRCSLLELTDATCRWPEGDPGTPEFFFCGGLPIDGAVYCAFHRAQAFNPYKRLQLSDAERQRRRMQARANRAAGVFI